MIKLNRLLLSIVLGLLVILYYNYDPALYSFFPKCPVVTYLHFYCVGCGSQRAVHKMLTGDIIEAANFNLLAVIYLPLIVFYYLSSLPGLKQYIKPPITSLINKKWFIYTTLIAMIMFCIVRNINSPIGKYLAP